MTQSAPESRLPPFLDTLSTLRMLGYMDAMPYPGNKDEDGHPDWREELGWRGAVRTLTHYIRLGVTPECLEHQPCSCHPLGFNCPQGINHCTHCISGGCIRVFCKRDRSECPCAPFHANLPASAGRRRPN